MAAYVIAEHVVTDAAKFDDYRTKGSPIRKASNSNQDMLFFLEGA
jgi:hypothetical protein